MKAEKIIRNEVEKWFITEPLFFAVWLSHKLVENHYIKNIRVGMGTIEYNPDFIISLTKSEVAEVLISEAMRIVLKHPYVRKKQNAQISYLASNITLQEYLGLSLNFPNALDIFHSKDFDKQYFEFYYNKLLENTNQKSKPDDLIASGFAIMKSNTGDSQKNSHNNKSNLQDKQQGLNESSFLNLYTDHSQSGIENTQHWDRDEFQVIAINDKIRYAQENQTWGTISGRFVDIILASLVPRLNYKQVLRHFRASVISNKRILTRMKPSRRYGFQYMGSKYDFSTKLLFAVDVSGSITNYDLQIGFSVINSIFKYGIEKIDVIQFDTEIKGEVLEFKRAKKRIKVLGRGGTDFNDIINYIDLNKQYDGLIIFTDGYAQRPNMPKNRKTRIVWLFNTESNYENMKKNVEHIGKSAFVR